MQKFRFEGLTLTVASIDRALDFYGGKLGLKIAHNASPHFAMIRTADGGTIGLLSFEEAEKDGAVAGSPEQRRGIHVEFSTDDLDALYADLTTSGVRVDVPPHDEPWERSMTVYDPDGHSVEFAQGRRGSNAVPGTRAEGQER
jgi:catechol 2,3-dioxygenase-like lactoylglutathione lyase family enzyme